MENRPWYKAEPWLVPMLASLVPFTWFAFAPREQWMLIGGIALGLVVVSMVMLATQKPNKK